MYSQTAAIYDCLEAVDSPILIIRSGKIAWANSAAAALTAYSTQRLTGMLFDELFSSNVSKPTGSGGETTLIQSSGTATPVRVSLKPVEFGEGDTAEIATLTALPARPAHSPETSADSRTNIYRHTIESGLDGFYVLEAHFNDVGEVADFTFIDVNQQGVQLSNFPREKLIGHTLRELYPTRAADFYTELHARVLKANRPIEAEYETQTPDGKKRWLMHQVVPLGSQVAVYSRDITERKRIEQALRASELGFQALLDQSNDCISLLDLDGNYLLVNRKLADTLGYEPDAMTEMHLSQFIVPNTPDQYQPVLDALSKGQPVPLFECTYQRKDGSQFQGEVSVSLVRNPDGSPAYIQSIMRDISWRKAAESALRESEERYRIISELISDYAYSFRVEPDGTPVSEWLTDSFIRMTGYTPEEIDALGSYALYAPGEEARVDADMRWVLSGHALSTDYRIVTKWGETRWVNIFRKPVWDAAQGRVVRMYGVAQDITERKLSEDKLRRSEEQYRLIAENATDMISRTDPSDVRIYVSSACRTLLGYEPDELLGPDAPPLIHPDDVATMEKAWQASEQTGDPITFTCRMRRKSGEYHWFEITGKTVLDPATNEIKEYLAISRDISNRLEMEAILKEQDRLRFELQKELELSEVKSNLMRTLSHEFRTPLTLIITSTDFLDAYFERLTPERRQERLHAIRLQVKRLSDMLDDISFVMQGTLQHMVAHPSPLDLEMFCRTIIDDIQSNVGRNHRLVLNSDGQLVAGVGDKALVLRILTNLLSNAIKYSPEGSTVQVNLYKDANDAVIEVADQGIGIAPEDQKRIFEAFYRGVSVLDSVGGTGLGLSIVKDCVDMHGGTITVRSTPGEGSTFIVRLPQVVA